MRRSRPLVASLAAVVVLGPLAWFWRASLLPDTYSVMGHVRSAQAGHGRSVTTLITDPDRPADVSVTLAARQEGGRITLNGQTPGPTIRAVAGQLVQVRLINESVAEGITLHWHGVDLPNAYDGVAGVTQDAVTIGQEFVYRFVADRAGTFWYHSHQLSHKQVSSGLLGALVIAAVPQVPDVVALLHLYGAVHTVNGVKGEQRVEAPPGQRLRVRVINTDNGPTSTWVGGSGFRVAAVDGVDLHQPAPLEGVAVTVTAGGRADLEITMPPTGSPVRLQFAGSASLVLGKATFDIASVARPRSTLDLLAYGTRLPLAFDPDKPDREYRYDIGRRPGFLDGRPGFWWTVNGHLFPDVPSFTVAQGDVVRMTVSNHSGEVHPMHLHGHHAIVLSRNGVRATGSQWWTDSLNVADGESYEIAFVADNPGIWMDHCHNLAHASEGLLAHLIYEGVTTPFMIGSEHGNRPE